ncbi:MAG: thiamine pyrophosphate-dependent dehydrogenase E1 component subunit alpha [Sulfobacillus thermosulfidooxidans]|uniref:thiamine pyrophosphate-dependent dehydrogenase E1 component subunit alpha n=1 Tax=Sulfobacillus TaxID=28033 RepID=UPI000CD30745|nr:thiamine pyrophosphate-dependent dehydrogenase E1 component subunit alpha [Sulfobacillus sp. hq2]POB12100.1 2-oxoisovalerate dehydrogenase [Sulfobacillus sp. hq2]PSR37815.1 MAG: thiamine pyrophosphate-dependent dehydrogenase E1 component subunit alpha [Sulfobacillus thermosulfidooxidans]
MAQREPVSGLPVDREKLKTMYYYMVLSRRLDERMWILNRQGKAPFVISCQGQEGAQAGVVMALDSQVDWIAPYYRDLAVVLAFGMTPREVMLGFLGKADDPSSGGRQMPAHYGHRARRIFTGSSPVATQVTQAAGLAWAFKLRHEAAVAVAFLGEGSTNQGEFHEALNFAAVQRVPLIVVVENNGYAISVPQNHQMAIHNVADRAAGYGIVGVVVQGSDPLAVYEAAHAARERAVAGGGPTLIEAKTYRYTAHSSDDDDRSYRSREELLREKADDPVVVFRESLMRLNVWDERQEERLQQEVRAVVDDATEYALNAAMPDPSTLMDHVYEKD